MKKQLNAKLNAKATQVLVKELDEKALEAVTGGGTIVTTGGGCRTCGLLVTTGT